MMQTAMRRLFCRRPGYRSISAPVKTDSVLFSFWYVYEMNEMPIPAYTKDERSQGPLKNDPTKGWIKSTKNRPGCPGLPLTLFQLPFSDPKRIGRDLFSGVGIHTGFKDIVAFGNLLHFADNGMRVHKIQFFTRYRRVVTDEGQAKVAGVLPVDLPKRSVGIGGNESFL